mmetsp:Transcript_30975/g.68650  ORF Transcript_30975/g.68650 Transcript_30975/m.68650 type:complete len:484 (-) Transcript_30975:553-2004(-)
MALATRSSTHPGASMSRAHALHQRGAKPFTSASCARQAGRQMRARGMARVVCAAALPREAEVVVVGAGVAGLSAALHLRKGGVRDVLLLEADDGVGGRVRTDVVDGFLLDRGFQIFLTGYPEAQALLDYPALDLKPFYAGALVHTGGTFHRVADPLRHPVDGLLSLTNPVGSVVDKVRVGVFRARSVLGSLEELLARPETSIKEKLKAEGFSDAITRLFFRPFLGGIFFDRELRTSSRLFEFVMRMLAVGSNCLPAGGIGAVAQQMAGRLPPESIKLGVKVDKVEAAAGGRAARVVLSDGSSIEAKRGVVVAVQGPEAKRMLGGGLASAPSKDAPGVGTCNLYFSAPSPPSPEPILYLNGEDSGIVNNCCFPSTVAPSYAPAGKALVSVSTVGTFDELSDAALEGAVRKHLSSWFGEQAVAGWSLLRVYRIPFAQPNQAPPTNFTRPVALGAGLFVCGDHRDSATLDGAIKSGRRAAEAVISA